MKARRGTSGAPQAAFAGRRWAMIALKIALSAELAYLAGANLALRLGMVQAALASTETIKVEFASAWSLWPGRVHAREVVVHMQDRHVQFVLRIARADVTIALRDLLRRTFHATRVRAQGVSFRFLHRIMPQSASAPFVSALPPLDGYPDPPILEAGPPPAPLSEAEYNLWTVHLEHVDAEVQELWLQTVRYQGRARAQGSFRLRPTKRLWVNPASLAFERGTLSTGGRAIVDDLEGEIGCTVDPFDVEPVVGLGMLPFVSTQIALRGEVPDFDALAPLASFEPWSLSGTGHLDVRATVNHGVIVDDSSAHYHSTALRLAHEPSGWAGQADIDVTLTGPSPNHPARLRVSAEHAMAQPKGGSATALELGHLELWASSSSVDLAESWTLTGAGGQWADVGVANLSALDPLLGLRNVHLLGGAAHVSATGAWSRTAWQSSLALSVEGARARLAEAQVETQAKLTARASGSKAAVEQASLELDATSMAIRQGDAHLATRATITAKYAQEPHHEGRWSADVTLPQLRAYQSGTNGDHSAECPFAELADARLHGALQVADTAPRTAEFHASVGRLRLSWGALIANADQADLTGHYDMNGAAAWEARFAASALSLQNGGGAPRSWQANARTVSIDGNLRDTGAELRGPLRLQVTGLRGQVGRTKIAAEVNAALALDARQAMASIGLRGDIAAREVAVTSGAREVRDWWANLRVSDGELRLGQTLGARAAVQGSMQNALPALNLLSSGGDVPGWLPSALPLEKLSLSLQLERQCRVTDVRVLEAKGGPLTAHGRFQLEPGETRGAILVSLPAVIPVSVGFDFVDDQSNSSSMVGEGWLARHTEAMDRGLRAARTARCTPEPSQCR